MDLIDYNEFHLFNKKSLSCFSCDDIPLFRSRNNNLGLLNLTFAQMDITCKLFNCNAYVLESVRKVSSYLCNKSLHRSYINHFELCKIDDARVRVSIVIDSLEDGQQSNVCLPGWRRSTHKHIPVVSQSVRQNTTLNRIESLETYKPALHPFRQRINVNQSLVDHFLRSRNVDFLITNSLDFLCSWRQLKLILLFYCCPVLRVM